MTPNSRGMIGYSSKYVRQGKGVPFSTNKISFDKGLHNSLGHNRYAQSYASAAINDRSPPKSALTINPRRCHVKTV